jgi:hypothetical protein
MAAPASAADMPARTYQAPPPMAIPVLYDWSGFYIGLNGGWGQATIVGIFLPRLARWYVTGAPTLLEEFSVDSSAIAGKVGIGCSVWKRRATGRTSAARVSV